MSNLDQNQNHRDQQRLYLKYMLKVLDQDSGEAIGFLHNLSPDGAMLLTDRQLSVDEVGNFRILATDDQGDEQLVDFVGQCRWQGACELTGMNKTGFKFLEIPEKSKVPLDYLIKLFSFTAYQ